MVQMDERELASLEPKLHKIFKRELGFYESDILNHTLSIITKVRKQINVRGADAQGCGRI